MSFFLSFVVLFGFSFGFVGFVFVSVLIKHENKISISFQKSFLGSKATEQYKSLQLIFQKSLRCASFSIKGFI